jgi:hypothetical protein
LAQAARYNRHIRRPALDFCALPKIARNVDQSGGAAYVALSIFERYGPPVMGGMVECR